MDYCQTCIYYPPSSCDGKPCTQCDPESQFQNCYVKKEADSKPTNADRIRTMSDEELAECIENPNGKPWYRCDECKWESCKECCLEWLKQEAT